MSNMHHRNQLLNNAADTQTMHSYHIKNNQNTSGWSLPQITGTPTKNTSKLANN